MGLEQPQIQSMKKKNTSFFLEKSYTFPVKNLLPR